MWDGTIAELAEHLSVCIYPANKMPRWLKEHLQSIHKIKATTGPTQPDEETKNESPASNKSMTQVAGDETKQAEKDARSLRSQELEGKRTELEPEPEIKTETENVVEIPVRAKRTRKSAGGEGRKRKTQGGRKKRRTQE